MRQRRLRDDTVLMDLHDGEEGAPALYPERRRHTRVDVVLPVRGELTGLNGSVTLLNVSAGGFLIQGNVSLPVGVDHEFRFTADGHEPVVVTGRITHVVRVARGTRVEYAMGARFADTGGQAQTANVERLVRLCEGDELIW
jgi:hypothetical protein